MEAVPTPVAEVRWDDEQIRGICQVLAEQCSVLLFLRLAQCAHQHRDDAKLIFVAADRMEAYFYYVYQCIYIECVCGQMEVNWSMNLWAVQI